jgi:hypothetical protein
MAKKTKTTKKAEPKKEVAKKEEVTDWATLYAVQETKTSHPDHKGKDIYMLNGSHGYFDEKGSFIKV